MGIPHRLLKAASIAQGALSGKSSSVLLAPGGTARLKAKALGTAGRAAIRSSIANGWHYLGLCGGAGLALSEKDGLGLCPWQRTSYSNRLQHLISGHIHVQAPEGHPLGPPDAYTLPLPVWWPGRFAPQEGDAVEILAAYLYPGGDVWLADLPLSALPPGTLASWEDMYGVSFRPEELSGQPCIIRNSYGQGSCILSYSHLETPDSPGANRWLAHLLRSLTGTTPKEFHCPSWDLAGLPVRWDDPVFNRARAFLNQIIHLGIEHNLLFVRTPWLWGWRMGIPGAALNNLFAALLSVQNLEPNDAALSCWEEYKALFAQKFSLFQKSAEQYLLAERLAATLASALPQAVDRSILNMQREALFGQPMEGGGLYEELTDMLEELIFRACEDGCAV
ncbi:MAG: biotin--protein ligase [Betaproteobacteria bacterium]|nr:biotin--protein ligase [Betaproteobacteria bacterium]